MPRRVDHVDGVVVAVGVEVLGPRDGGGAGVGILRQETGGGGMTEKNEDKDKISAKIKESFFVSGSKQRSFREFTDMKGYSDEEIQKMARDKSLPPELRQKAKTTEKLRGLRNKQKRASKFDYLHAFWKPLVKPTVETTPMVSKGPIGIGRGGFFPGLIPGLVPVGYGNYGFGLGGRSWILNTYSMY